MGHLKRLTKFLPLILVVLLSFFAWQALLRPGYFSMHDDQQIVRLFEFDKALSYGQFPVRWLEGLGFGYGYPLFNFYPPFVYYLGEIFHLGLSLSFIDSIKLVWFTALLGSALAMYFLVKELFGKLAGLVSAVFYLYAPYHAVDTYVRGALAELFSFVWLPLILLFSYRFFKTDSLKTTLWAGFTLGLLMITHNLIFLPFVGIFAVWSAGLVLIHRKPATYLLRAFVLPVGLAFLLTAFFWLPALAEKKFTLVDEILIKNLASYNIHFVCPNQLWASQWGFAGSIAGCADGLSLSLGKIHIAVTALATLSAPVLLIRRKTNLGFLILLTSSLLWGSLFMTTSYSKFLWDNLKELWYIQFPWRFLEFATLFSAILAGSLLGVIKQSKLNILIAVILIVTPLALYAKHFSPQYFYESTTDSNLTTDYYIKWYVSSTSFEFIPAGVATKINDQGVVWVDIDEKQVSKSRYLVGSGDFVSSKDRFAPDRFELTGKSQTGAQLIFQITHFPGWRVWVDGQEVVITDTNPYKLITVAVPAGDHQITGRFTNTLPRTIGNLVSLGSLVLVAGYFYGTRRSKK